MKTLLGALALVLALPMSSDVAAQGVYGAYGGASIGGWAYGDEYFDPGFYPGYGYNYPGYGGYGYGGYGYGGYGGYSGYPPGYGAVAPAAPSRYYCNKPAGYYPRVQNCAGGWMSVPAAAVPPG